MKETNEIMWQLAIEALSIQIEHITEEVVELLLNVKQFRLFDILKFTFGNLNNGLI